jgi:chemotaxis protein MotB
MAGKGGGAWKVAYADFVTAMMAFFLVMWIVAQNKPVKEAVAAYFRDPSGAGSHAGSDSAIPMKGDGPSPLNRNAIAPKQKPADKVGTRTKKSPKPPRVVVEGDEGSNIGTEVLFSEDSAELDQHARRVLDDVIPTLLGKFNKIEIRGHSNGRRLPPGGPYKNLWELSYARSFATMRYMIDKGVDPRRLRLSQSAANDPKQIADATEGRMKNSRVEVYVLSEVINDPSHPEERRGERGKRQGARASESAAAGEKESPPQLFN